jgi:hypothetical protein
MRHSPAVSGLSRKLNGAPSRRRRLLRRSFHTVKTGWPSGFDNRCSILPGVHEEPPDRYSVGNPFQVLPPGSLGSGMVRNRQASFPVSASERDDEVAARLIQAC